MHNLNKNTLVQALIVGALALVAGFLSTWVSRRVSPMLPSTGLASLDNHRQQNIANFLTGFVVFVAVSVYGYTCNRTAGVSL